MGNAGEVNGEIRRGGELGGGGEPGVVQDDGPRGNLEPGQVVRGDDEGVFELGRVVDGDDDGTVASIDGPCLVLGLNVLFCAGLENLEVEGSADFGAFEAGLTFAASEGGLTLEGLTHPALIGIGLDVAM